MNLDAPCRFCGYNSSGYWQAGTHAAGCPWHKIGGFAERELVAQSFPVDRLPGGWVALAVAKTWPEGSVVLVRLQDTEPTKFPNQGARFRIVQYWVNDLPVDDWIYRHGEAFSLLALPRAASEPAPAAG